MNGNHYLLYLPEIALEKIFSFLTYDEIAKNRIMSHEDELLDNLLSAATVELENLNKQVVLKETDIFQHGSNLPQRTPYDGSSTVLHNKDTDSSDGEDNRNYEDKKYSKCGKDIKYLLKHQSLQSSNYDHFNKTSTWKKKTAFETSESSVNHIDISKVNADVYTDPVFGMRIINPLISSTVLKERMMGREAVQFSRVSRYLQVYNKEKDWVIAGVIVNKSAVKTSQKGSQFCIWTLSDLKDDIKTVSLFLFSSAHKQLWKTVVGTVVGILNPNVLDKKDGSKDEACLGVDNSQKVMIFGQSKDFGTCKSTKKNGEPCTAVVNLNRCEYCLYHIKQEYQKCSKRSELQANFTGRGLKALRNKVLGKNEVFYAGKSYMAIPAKRDKKVDQRDNKRLQSLSRMGVSTLSNNIIKAKNKNTLLRKQNASRLDVSQAQRLRDMDLIKKLGGPVDNDSKNIFMGTRSSEVILAESKNNAKNIINKLKEKCNSSILPKENSKSEHINTNNKHFQEKLSKNANPHECKTNTPDIVASLKSKPQTSEDSNSSKCESKFETGLINDDVINNSVNLDDNINLNFGSKSSKKIVKFDILQSDKDQCSTNKTRSDKSILSKELTLTQTLSSRELASTFNISINEERSSLNIEKVTPLRKSYLNSVEIGFPTLSIDGSRNLIDLNKPITYRHIERAKLNAVKFVHKNGTLPKADPNNTKGSGKKRPVEEMKTSIETGKKSKLAESEFISDRFKKMMAATSKHLDLLESRDDEEKEKYFDKLEKKEQMEEKMTNTFKVPCKAVRCLRCKYTSFSASEICKNEKHPLKVFDAMKRFFKCGNCGNRTVTLGIIPTGLCKNCGGGKWERTGMMKEKVAVAAQTLSIRGGEQKFVNSDLMDANINLLVPD